jgi:REP element-mobilizing transposase RayT
MAYWRLHYHAVWTTYQREPLITAARERVIRTTLYAKARELGLTLHEVGGMEEHLHVVVSAPPTLAVADWIRHLKGATSRAVNRMRGANGAFRWQDSYGALSIGGRSLATVIAYVRNQRQHHLAGTIISAYEQTTEADTNPAPS